MVANWNRWRRVALLAWTALVLTGCVNATTARRQPPATTPSQQPTQEINQLPSAVAALESELIRGQFGWKRSILARSTSHPALNPREAYKELKRVRAWEESWFKKASKNPRFHDESWVTEHAQYPRQADRIANLFEERLVSLGSRPALFVASTIELAPSNFIRFANVEGETALLLCGLTVEDVFNTNRTTPRSRAALVAEQAVIPALRTMSEVFGDSDLPRLGAMVFYGSQDFLNDAATPQCESVALVCRQKDLREFLAGSTTIQEFTASSQAFVGSSLHVTRSTLKFE